MHVWAFGLSCETPEALGHVSCAAIVFRLPAFPFPFPTTCCLSFALARLNKTLQSTDKGLFDRSADQVSVGKHATKGVAEFAMRVIKKRARDALHVPLSRGCQ